MIYYLKKLIQVKSFTFEKYPQKKIILFDNYTFSNLRDLLKNKDYITIDTSLNKLNLRIIFKLILKFKLKTANYFSEIIKEINPKLVLTIIDQNSNFWRLKKIVNDNSIKFVIIQNGWREDPFVDINNGYEDFSVDEAFVFNSFMGDLYKKKLKCNYLKLGSVKNNFYFNDDGSNKIKDSILFINQINPFKKNIEEITFTRLNKNYSWSQFYKADFLVLDYIKKYCDKNNLKLFLLGRNNRNKENEKKIFYNYLKYKNVNYIENLSVMSAYEQVSNFDLVINLDSTLGYEVLIKSTIKMCCFSIRGSILNLESNDMNFGWPGHFEDDGFFWSNKYDEKKFDIIMKNNLCIDVNKWREKNKKINESLMTYSENNQILNEYLSKVS